MKGHGQTERSVSYKFQRFESEGYSWIGRTGRIIGRKSRRLLPPNPLYSRLSRHRETGRSLMGRHIRSILWPHSRKAGSSHLFRARIPQRDMRTANSRQPLCSLRFPLHLHMDTIQTAIPMRRGRRATGQQFPIIPRSSRADRRLLMDSLRSTGRRRRRFRPRRSRWTPPGR